MNHSEAYILDDFERINKQEVSGVRALEIDVANSLEKPEIVAFNNVSKWFGTSQVLNSITLNIMAQEVCVVCGPSGSGKTTLLRCINGLEQVQRGEITVMGDKLTDQVLASSAFRSQIGMVFQKFSLYPHMNVLSNMTLGLRKVLGINVSEAEDRAMRLLGRVGLQDRAKAFPSELSGGQQQRVAIARALVMEPKIMLFDEPTSALDPEMIREVLDVMRELAKRGMTMITVTHEMEFAREVADRIIFMDQGSVLEDAPVKEFFTNAKSPRAQHFLDRLLRH
jgi:ABC-type polar amino acid transport system ATPase subunit